MTATDADPAYQAFASQAKKCESFASRNPDGYRWRVSLLALLGYLFPPAVLLALVGGFLAIVWLYFSGGYRGGGFVLGKLAAPIIVLIIMVARAMWPRFGKPEGLRLRRAHAPDLFAFIDDLRAKAGRPKVDRVYLVDEMNAAVRQTPRLGLFGWHRNDLILGLPLMQALPKRELAAVIAHEFGHLSGAHGKLGAWVYRTRLLMARILYAIEQRKYFGSWIFRWFYRWYEPYFAAYSFALAREQEYEADRMAAEAVSGQSAIDALVRISIADDYMGRVFWRDIWSGAARDAAPPALVYEPLGKGLAALDDWEDACKSLRARIADKTDYADTHPSLGDRAQALGVEPGLPAPAADSAVSLLPDHGAELAAKLSQEWREAAAETWDGYYREAQEEQRRLADLDAAAGQGPLSDEDALARGLLAESHLGREAGLERIEQALSWSEWNDGALFARGRILLAMGRDEGLTCLDQVMARDDDAILPACEMAEAHLIEAGRGDEAESYRRRREEQLELLDQDWVDRHRIDRDDKLVAHDCSEERVEEILSAIESFKKKGLKRAWLLRKVTQHRPWAAAHFLICELGGIKRWTQDAEELQGAIAGGLAQQDDLVVFVCDVDDGWLRDKALAVPDAQIYPRS